MTKQLDMLIQNTPEWYEYRRTRYGASDYASVMSGNRLSTIKNKVYPTKDQSNSYSAWGHNREPVIRELLSDKLEIHCGAVVIQSDNDRIYASVDGFDDLTGNLLEIKTCKFTGDKLLDKLQEWAYQLSHQYYCVNEPIFTITLAVELYETITIDGKLKFIPKYITVYTVSIAEADPTRMFFIPYAQIDSVTGEVTNIDNTDPKKIIYCNIQTRDEWLKHCEEFLFDLDNQFFQENSNDTELHELIDQYVSIQDMLKTFTEEQNQLLNKLKFDIDLIMSNENLKLCKTNSGHSASISYRKKPMTEKYVREKLTDVDFDNPEYQKTVLDVDKLVKIYNITPDTTKLITIK